MEKAIAYILPSIILLAFLLRLTGIDWDQGYYLHPDERAIVMFTLPLRFPSSFVEFLRVDSPLNPHFFAYGSFPLYLLSIAGHLASWVSQYLGEYSGIYIVGRSLTVVLDTGIVLLVFLVARRIFNQNAGVVAAFFYAIAVLPIQSSHFYTSDVFISFFLLLSFFLLIIYLDSRKLLYLLLSSISFGIAVASKVTATAFLGVVFVGLFWEVGVGVFHKYKFKRIVHEVFNGVGYFLIFILLSFLVFCIFEPYAIIDFSEFLRQITEQQAMTQDASVFPYTIQYMGKLPYLYEIEQIFFWGMGVIVAPICFAGFFYFGYITFVQRKQKQFRSRFLLLFFFLLFFIILGSFAVGWMRYMLLLYPLLSIFGGCLVTKILEFLFKRSSNVVAVCISILLFLICISWTAVFVRIYSSDNPRVAASIWIHKNISEGSVIATEHWDDVLPLYGAERYTVLSLPVYDVDDGYKKEVIGEMLEQSDYIVISSQRAYLPIMRLDRCSPDNSYRCYPDTSEYYKSLFSGKLPFYEIKEFSNFAKIPFFNIPVVDLSADESFSVYDHPKVMIFKRRQIDEKL